MDFKLVLEKLLTAFEKENIQYALIGGFALGLLGVGRATVDIDFLITHSDIEKVNRIMAELGYECKYRTKNVSQFVSPMKTLGEVDFLHAFKDSGVEMIQRAKEKQIFGGALTVKTLEPEDLIGLKLQAIKNQPERKEIDLSDIRMLIEIHKSNLNWSLTEEYFRLFEMNDLYQKIKKEAGR